MYVYEDTGRLSSISSQSSAVRDEIQKIFLQQKDPSGMHEYAHMKPLSPDSFVLISI
jgi:hypothetical protein